MDSHLAQYPQILDEDWSGIDRGNSSNTTGRLSSIDTDSKIYSYEAPTESQESFYQVDEDVANGVREVELLFHYLLPFLRSHGTDAPGQVITQDVLKRVFWGLRQNEELSRELEEFRDAAEARNKKLKDDLAHLADPDEVERAKLAAEKSHRIFSGDTGQAGQNTSIENQVSATRVMLNHRHRQVGPLGQPNQSNGLLLQAPALNSAMPPRVPVALPIQPAPLNPVPQATAAATNRPNRYYTSTRLARTILQAVGAGAYPAAINQLVQSHRIDPNDGSAIPNSARDLLLQIRTYGKNTSQRREISSWARGYAPRP